MTGDVAEVVQGLMQPALSISEHDLAAVKTRIASQLGSHMLVCGDPNYGERYVAAEKPARSNYWAVSDMALKHQSFVPVSVHIGWPHKNACSRNRVT